MANYKKQSIKKSDEITSESGPLLTPTEDHNWLRAKIMCPNCGRVAKVVRINIRESKKFTNLECDRCPIKPFKWPKNLNLRSLSKEKILAIAKSGSHGLPFDWEYSIPQPRPEKNWYPRYARITIDVGIPLHNMPRVQKYNEKHFGYSNK